MLISRKGTNFLHRQMGQAANDSKLKKRRFSLEEILHLEGGEVLAQSAWRTLGASSLKVPKAHGWNPGKPELIGATTP